MDIEIVPSAEEEENKVSNEKPCKEKTTTSQETIWTIHPGIFDQAEQQQEEEASQTAETSTEVPTEARSEEITTDGWTELRNLARNDAEDPRRSAMAKAALKFLESYDEINRKAAKGTKEKLQIALETVKSTLDQRRSTIFDMVTAPIQDGETKQDRAARVAQALRAWNF